MRTSLVVAFLAIVAHVLALGPENTIIVVNDDSPDSVAIAAEYVKLRHIPSGNIIRLSALPKDPVIKADDFRNLILKPILDTIRSRGLQDQIDLVAYSAGFPYGVDVSADMGGKSFPMYITQPASLTGLTYLYELTLAKDITYLSLDVNGYYRAPKSASKDTPWSAEDLQRQKDVETLFAKFHEAQKANPTPNDDMKVWMIGAGDGLRKLEGAHPNSPDVYYNIACAYALQGKTKEAISALTVSCRLGWWSAAQSESDPDLASLRDRPDFKALMDRVRSVVIETDPPVPFHAAEPIGGRRYLLSAMLAYTGGIANTMPEALASLRASALADGTIPKGTVYFMRSDDAARTSPRIWAFNSAAAALKKLGVNAEVIHGVLPPNKQDVAGAVVGIATFSWKDSGSHILPGAFCDHLTSCAGIMTGGGQTLLSEWLRSGAAGSSGTVTEPYALQQKSPTPFLQVFYASGCTLAEAFYQSVSGPYQQLLVGDPLCRPWGKMPTLTVKGLKSGDTLRESVALLVTASGASRLELYVDGVLKKTVKPGSALTIARAWLKPGSHEARVVAVGPMDVSARQIMNFYVK